MAVIKGGNSGDVADVDSSKKLQTRATTETSAIEAILDGGGFTVGTPDITLTSANESAILFFQNDGDSDLVFISARTNIGPSTGGTENFAITRFYASPTGMISGSGLDALIGNGRFGSSLTVESTSETGIEAAAITGTAGNDGYADTEASSTADFFFVLPKGESFGFSLEPPTGNTSVIVSILFSFYKDRGA